MRQLAAALHRGNSPQAQLAGSHTHYPAVDGLVSHLFAARNLSRQQDGASQHPPKKRQPAAALQSAASPITNALHKNLLSRAMASSNTIPLTQADKYQPEW